MNTYEKTGWGARTSSYGWGTSTIA